MPDPVDRRKICDAITVWRDGGTFDAIHPLANDESHGILWDSNAMKDLGRVIASALNGEEIPFADLPWSPSPPWVPQGPE